jgi:uncharacterized integral membrane protein
LFKAAVAVVLVVLAIIVVFQNTEAVDTRVLFGTLSMPHALLLAFTFTSGMLAGAILCRRSADRN